MGSFFSGPIVPRKYKVSPPEEGEPLHNPGGPVVEQAKPSADNYDNYDTRD